MAARVRLDGFTNASGAAGDDSDFVIEILGQHRG